MANKAKLEFINFVLEHKTGQHKTFFDFLVEQGKCGKNTQPKNAFVQLYKYFMEPTMNGYAKAKGLKKVFTVVDKKTNRFKDNKPKPDMNKYIISGVVNAGDYGYDLLMTELGNKQEASHIDTNKALLHYVYIFVYLPLDSNVGFIMVHSNTRADSIAPLMRNYVKSIFEKGDFKKPTITTFIPKDYSKEYKKGAVIKGLSFHTRIIDVQMPNESPIKDNFGSYDIKISIKPNDSSTPFSKVGEVYNWFKQKCWGTKDKDTKRVEEFEEAKEYEMSFGRYPPRLSAVQPTRQAEVLVEHLSKIPHTPFPRLNPQ